MLKLDLEKIKNFYNTVSNVWAINDPWHEYSRKTIATFLSKKDFFADSVVLNAGSAGNTYDIVCKKMYHVDVADQKLAGIENAVVASIEHLPFDAESFDNIVCVGSVLNYCDALSAISELSRVLKPEGNLILEYESSWGFEYLGFPDYKKDACVITTEYIEEEHVQWLYSPKYVESIIRNYNLVIIEKMPFHIFDGIVAKFAADKMANLAVKTDIFLRYFPYFKNHGNNIIMHCKKKN